MDSENIKKQNIVSAIFKNELSSIIMILVALVIVLSILSPVFLTEENIINVFRQASTLGMATLGMSGILLTGEIDLSIGSSIAAVGVLTVVIANKTKSLALALICGIALGMIISYLASILITKLNILAFIATYGMQAIVRGLLMVITNAKSIPNENKSLQFLGTGYIGPIPFQVILLILSIVIMWIVMSKTTFGRAIYAVGGNSKAAKLSGLNVEGYKTKIFLIEGFFTGLVGIITAARMNSGQPSSSTGYEMQAISSAVLGGVSMSGGRGNILGAIIGAFILQILANGMVLLNISSFYQDVVKGVVLVISVLVDVQRQKKNKDS